MTSNVTIVTTAFENVQNGDKRFGYRIYDEHTVSYDNVWYESLEEAKNDEPLQMLADIIDNPGNDEIGNMIDLISSLHLGITINNQDFTWDEIKHLF